MKNKLLLLLLSIFSAFSFSQNHYQNQDYGFSINFPDGWQQKDSWVEYCLRKATNNTSSSISYISVAASPSDSIKNQKINEASALEAYELTKIDFNLTEAKLINSGTSIFDNIEMKWSHCEYDYGVKKLNFKNYYFGWKEWFFRFTFMSDGGTERFEQLLPQFEATMKTLKMDR
ncbi:MAG: hypothetical protein MI810_04190 [Flavobacteriales bacterium]|nr:hypothetical protein [Flavobacteriales bacterium]